MNPAPFIWTGEAFEPRSGYWRDKINDQIGAGEVVTLVRDEPRSGKSHNHEFAMINEYWQNLPERLMGYPWAATPETLRKHALIATGHCNVEVLTCGSKASALEMAAYASSRETKIHGYAITEVDGTCVRVITPHSQSKKAMGRNAFQQSKTDVLEWIEAQLGLEAA